MFPSLIQDRRGSSSTHGHKLSQLDNHYSSASAMEQFLSVPMPVKCIMLQVDNHFIY